MSESLLTDTQKELAEKIWDHFMDQPVMLLHSLGFSPGQSAESFILFVMKKLHITERQLLEESEVADFSSENYDVGPIYHV